MQEAEVFYPSTVADWRKWLEENHRSKSSVWLVCQSKASGKPSVSWSDSVDVALCYGWIDSKKIKVDQETTHQFFSRRKAKSTWSKINKDKISKLTETGLMSQAGHDSVEIAKKNGSWTLLDEVEGLVVPTDLEQALVERAGAKEFFDGLSKSARKAMLQWLVLARRAETRQSRIDEIAELASRGMKPKQF